MENNISISIGEYIRAKNIRYINFYWGEYITAKNLKQPTFAPLEVDSEKNSHPFLWLTWWKYSKIKVIFALTIKVATSGWERCHILNLINSQKSGHLKCQKGENSYFWNVDKFANSVWCEGKYFCIIIVSKAADNKLLNPCVNRRKCF